MSENKQSTFSVNFFQGNTNRIGVNYFADEDAVKFGVERTKNLINIFSVKGYTVERIGLCGGVDELSHTGYVSYSAAYTDAKMFCDNAYSDYVTAKEKAEAEYGSWLSSYNFTDFSILFVNASHSVRVFVGAGKNITLRSENGSHIETELLDEIIPIIKKDIYQDNCLIDGIDMNDNLETKELLQSNKKEEVLGKAKQELIGQKLYVVVSTITKMPYVLGDGFFMLYSDKGKAIKYARSIHQQEIIKYGEEPVIITSEITNKEKFVEIMMQLGYTKFLLDGDGKILELSEFSDFNYEVSTEEKSVYNAQLTYEKLSESSHIGKAKAAQIERLRTALLSDKYAKTVGAFKKLREQLNTCYTQIDNGKEVRNTTNTKTTIINGVDATQYTKGYSYGKTSLGWGIASIFLYTFLLPSILGIVYGIKSIKFTNSIGEAVNKKAVFGVLLSLFSIIISIFVFKSIYLGE